MHNQFDQIAERALRLERTVPELLREAGVTPSSFSRARRGKSGDLATLRVIRALKAKLDELETQGVAA